MRRINLRGIEDTFKLWYPKRGGTKFDLCAFSRIMNYGDGCEESDIVCTFQNCPKLDQRIALRVIYR